LHHKLQAWVALHFQPVMFTLYVHYSTVTLVVPMCRLNQFTSTPSRADELSRTEQFVICHRDIDTLSPNISEQLAKNA